MNQRCMGNVSLMRLPFRSTITGMRCPGFVVCVASANRPDTDCGLVRPLKEIKMSPLRNPARRAAACGP